MGLIAVSSIFEAKSVFPKFVKNRQIYSEKGVRNLYKKDDL